MLQDLDTSMEEYSDCVYSRNSRCFQAGSYHSLSLKEPILSGSFLKADRTEIMLLLFEDCVVMTNDTHPSPQHTIGILPISDNSAFSTLVNEQEETKVLNVLTFFLLKPFEEQFLYSDSATTTRKWQVALAALVNQVDFPKQYSLIRPIGKGLTSEVYLAQRVTDGMHFAVKVLSRLHKKPLQQQAFFSQINTLRHLDHPNILRYQAAFVSSDHIYIVTEYFQAGTLYDQITTHPQFDKHQQTTMLGDLLSAVEYLRSRKIAHRDIKLQNVYVRLNGDGIQLVLGDFGMAVSLEDHSPLFNKCGSPGSTAPEVLRHSLEHPVHLTDKADIFSLGCVFHVILTSRTVFQYNGDIEELVALNKKCVIHWRDPVYHRLSRHQLQLLQSMLTQNPGNRQSSQELAELPYFKSIRKGAKNLNQVCSPKAQEPHKNKIGSFFRKFGSLFNSHSNVFSKDT